VLSIAPFHALNDPTLSMKLDLLSVLINTATSLTLIDGRVIETTGDAVAHFGTLLPDQLDRHHWQGQ
jgi:hypothetical protein